MATIVTAPCRALNWTATATETNEYGRWEWRRHHAAPAVHRAAHPICYLIYPTPTVLCSISSDPETGCAARIAPRGLVSLPSPSVCPALPRREGRAFLLVAGFLHRCAVAWFMAGYAGLHSTDVPCRRQVWICRETSWTCTAGNDTVWSSTPVCKPAKTLPHTPSFTQFVGLMRFSSGFQMDSELYYAQLHGMFDVGVVERTTPEHSHVKRVHHLRLSTQFVDPDPDLRVYFRPEV
jgi:hypothetical protein